MRPCAKIILAAVLWAAALTPPATATTGLWDLPDLRQAPAVEWGRRDGSVQEIYYAGEPHAGKPTRVFAYLARPAKTPAGSRLPAVVLVHGGGGQAFRSWAETWAARGYVALAMDLSGNGPGKVRLPDGGPPLTTPNVFKVADQDEQMRDGWTYHAVAAVIRAHSVLAGLPEVDANRIGLTGISWGGYVTCIVAGLDHRFKVAVPVYGCGYLHESSYWKKEFVDPMTPEQLARWVRLCDPSGYLAQVECPILFVNGTNDPRFFLDSYCRSFRLVRPELRSLSLQVGLKHGHNWKIGEVDRFIDAVLQPSPPPPRLGEMTFDGGVAQARLIATDGIAKVEFFSAAAAGSWLDRKWQASAARLEADRVTATPPAARPLVGFFMVTDERGFKTTTPYFEFPH